MKYEIKTLSDLSIDGKGHYGIAAPAVEYSESLPTYLRITDINDNGTIDYSGLKSVSDDNASDYFLKANDIVFARTGASTGRNYFYDGTGGKFVYAGFLIKFSIDEKKVNPKYVKYYCMSQLYRDWVSSFSTGSTRGNINAQTYGNMPILLPSRPQQDFLVQILSALDDKIELNNQINKNLEEQAQALYKQMFETVPYSSRRICKADECFDISIGKTPPRKEPEWFSFNPTDVNWVSISDMGNCGLYISSTSERLTLDAVKQHNIKMVPDNTVLLSFKLTVGRVAITNGEMTTNEAIAHFKTENKDIVEYLYFYLKGFNFQTMGSTSSIAVAVNSKMIKAMPFVMPDTEKLLQFHSVVGPMFAEIKANQVASNKLKELRDSLLPKLMSGEIDVDNVEI